MASVRAFVRTFVRVAASLLALAVFTAGPASAQLGDPTVLVVEPGEAAATPERAAAFLDLLASWLGEKVPALGRGEVVARIANTREGAVELLRTSRPRLVFAPPGFHLEHLADGKHDGRAVAEIPRFGAGEDRFYLVTVAGGPSSPGELSGARVAGAAGLDREYLARVVFPDTLRPDRAFRLEEAGNLTDEVFEMLEGAAGAPAALLLDEELKRFFEDDDLIWPELRVIWRSDPLPRDLVVALGAWTGSELGELEEALVEMGDDPDGERILELMQSSGLRPVDRGRLEEARRRYREGG